MSSYLRPVVILPAGTIITPSNGINSESNMDTIN